MEKIRVGIIGAGRLGGFHAQKLAARDDVQLVAVADPCEAGAQAMAEKHGCKAYADYRDIHVGEMDAAIIATPSVYHHQVGLDLLNQGVHVLMEKPLAVNSQQADDLVRAADASSVILQVGHVERFNPALDTAISHLGQPKYIEATRASKFTFRSTDIGVVLDLMVHDIDLVLSMVRSPVRRVEALGSSVVGGHEDMANARLFFENGCIATLNASRVSDEPARKMSIWSNSAFASIDFGALSAKIIRPSDSLVSRKFDSSTYAADQPQDRMNLFHDEHLPVETFDHSAVDAISLEDADFIESIIEGRQPRVTGSDARDAVAVAEMVLDSIASHAWDGSGRVTGPMAMPTRSIIPTPQFEAEPQRRKAG